MPDQPIQVCPGYLRAILDGVRMGEFRFVRPADVFPELPLDRLLARVKDMYDFATKKNNYQVNAAFIVLIGTNGDSSFTVPSLVFEGSVGCAALLQYAAYFLGQGSAFYLLDTFPTVMSPMCVSCGDRPYCASMSAISFFYGMASAVNASILSKGGTDPDDSDYEFAYRHAVEYLRYLRDRLDFLIELFEHPSEVEARLNESSD